MAANAIRSGVLAKYSALADAGINAVPVDMWVAVGETQAQTHLGIHGETQYHRFRLIPTPEVSINRREMPGPNGLENRSDVFIKGAFPTALAYAEVFQSGTISMAGTPGTVSFDAPIDFRKLVEKAAYFVIEDEKYVYRGRGFLAVNALQSEWKLSLVRAAK